MADIIREQTEVFKRLVHYTAPQSFQDKQLPNLILDNIVEHALYLHSKPVSLKKISGVIKEHLKLSYTEEELLSSVKRLRSKGAIVDNGSNLCLEARLREKIKQEISNKEKHEQEIINKLIGKVKEKFSDLSDKEIQNIRQDFQQYLALFFLTVGAEAVQLIYGNPESVSNVLGEIQKKDIFGNLPANKNDRIRGIEREFFPKFIEILSDEEKVYLQDLLDVSLQYFTLTVDKKCEALLLLDFADWNVFVDTNFIYNLLGLNDKTGKDKVRAERVIELGKKAGIKFFVTPATLEEFNSSVSSAREVLLKDEISEKYYEIACEATGNSIVCAYDNVWKKSGIRPKDFLTKIEHVKDILKSYDIDENNAYANSLKRDPSLRSTGQALSKMTGKDGAVAEHDAFHYLLILKLRSQSKAESTFTSNKHWFLTLDGLLAPFDWKQRKNEIPFCIKPYQLKQLLAPLFSRNDDFDAVFTEFITQPSSRAFPAVSPDIAVEILKRVEFYENEYKLGGSVDLASKILKDQHFISQIREMNAENLPYVDFIDQKIKSESSVEEAEPIQVQERSENLSKNYWNYVNPFWLMWQVIKCLLWLIISSISWINSHKIISGLATSAIVIIGVIGTDYGMVSSNIQAVLNWFKNIFLSGLYLWK